MAPGAVDQPRVWEQAGPAPAVLCLHETAATSEVWRPLAAALAGRARAIAYDRPGWGASPAPDTYTRTTVTEQAAVAVSVLELQAAAPALLAGAGLGAVVALELTVRRPELVRGAILVEPPLLAFVPEATDALSEAAELVREAVSEGGRGEALARHQAGALGLLGAGADRVPQAARARGDRAAASLFAELGAVPGWELPLGDLSTPSRPLAIVVGDDTPAFVRDAAVRLARATPGSELREMGPGLPHHDQASALAELVLEVGDAGEMA